MAEGSDIAYECMMAARSYAAQIRDMQRNAAALEGGQVTPEFSRHMTHGLIILAERVGAQRLCGLSDSVASNQITEISKALTGLLAGDLDTFKRSLDMLF